MQQSEKWNHSQWGESVASVACKIADPKRATVKVGNIEQIAVMKQECAEWLALIYHVERRKNPRDEDFHLVLIGRPIWVRARYLAVTPTPRPDEVEPAEKYKEHWKEELHLKDGSTGWPLYIYRWLLARRGIESDL
jgi:hypothetical protein